MPCYRNPNLQQSTVTHYQKRISDPLLDRIDIQVEISRVDYEKLSDDRFGEPSSKVQARVESARELQRYRFQNSEIERKPKKSRQISSNSDMDLLKSAHIANWMSPLNH